MADPFLAFLDAWLPSPPARVLEVGCGEGALARMLQSRGYDVLAIDPVAPVGPIFRQVRLEELDDRGPFGAVVASVSLHHVEDLDRAVEQIESRLGKDSFLVLRELDRDLLLSEATARWYHAMRRERERFDAPPVSEDFADWLAYTRAMMLEHVHPADAIRAALARRFDELAWSRSTYLFHWSLGADVEPIERVAIDAGVIDATGILYAGRPREARPG